MAESTSHPYPHVSRELRLERFDPLKVLLALLLPPLGVYLETGPRKHFWLSLLLTACFWIPGVAHALWIIATR